MQGNTMKLAILMLSMAGWLIAGMVVASERAEVAWDQVDSGAVLIDVRTPEEFAEGHLDNAINIPVSDIPRADLSFLTDSQQIVVYCRSGRRSHNAEQLLENLGFTQVHNGGGLQEMQAVKPD